ncbi:Programmed cell death protein 6 [Fragariocoptes setiger]|uniref:Programmed cell death protein 6 n=1 Tax=Fragariocoptes setiger TaxID=1670756 RepID=A0ABQ7S6A8_9ACAR|nr:Programmed cell death protein 6 [Fragariocoptes setiger]
MAAPAVDDNFLRQIFYNVDKDRSGFIDEIELQSVLSNGTWDKFSIDTVKLLISLFGKGRPGQVGYDEFKKLWNYVGDWLKTFQSFDKDKSGYINKDELTQSLKVFNPQVSEDYVTSLLYKYAKGGQVGKIFFDDFIFLSVQEQMKRTSGNTPNATSTTTPSNAPSGATPPTVDENFLRQVFYNVDKDRSGFIDAAELASCLSNGSFEPFNPETVRMMITLFDKTRKGQINFEEFKALWKYVEDWRNCFLSFDKDKSGYINRDELRQCLTAFGYQVTEDHINAVLRKFVKAGQGWYIS